MNDITMMLCCFKFKPYSTDNYLLLDLETVKLSFSCTAFAQIHKHREREREPLLSAATQCMTELFEFIEKVPPFSAINLCKDSGEWDWGTLTKSVQVKENYIATIIVMERIVLGLFYGN